MEAPPVRLRPGDRYVLPDALRGDLQGRFGDVHTDDTLRDAIGDRLVVAVGDHVSTSLRRLGIAPKAFVCDYHTQRGNPSQAYRDALGDWGDHVVAVDNPPGMLTAAAWDACTESLERDGTTRIEVTGEEDLLALPFFLALPVGACLVYGVPNVGAAVVPIDAALQDRVAGIVERMRDASDGS